MRDLLVAFAALAVIGLFLRLAIWPLVRRIPKDAPITMMAKTMDDVVKQHRAKQKGSPEE